jgi:hypothetical protein
MEIFIKTKLTQDKSKEILTMGERRIVRAVGAGVDVMRHQPPALPRAEEHRIFPHY